LSFIFFVPVALEDSTPFVPVQIFIIVLTKTKGKEKKKQKSYYQYPLVALLCVVLLVGDKLLLPGY